MNRVRCISLMCLACEVSLFRTQPSRLHARGGWRGAWSGTRAQMRAAVEKDGPGGPILAAYGKEKSSITFEAYPRTGGCRDGPCFRRRPTYMDSRHKIDESLSLIYYDEKTARNS